MTCAAAQRRSTSTASRTASATLTAATPSASGPCWPAGWSRPACRSSRSTTAAGTITPTSSPACRKSCVPFENAIAALIEDLEARGLLETTLVVALGEFGRTPKIPTSRRRAPGRDHWSNAMSVLFAGGGTPGGQVVGATDRNGYAAVERVLSPENFASTVYASSASTPARSITPRKAGPVHLVSDPTPISELMG